MPRPAYDIPAIFNEFEVLAIFLGIAEDNDQERAQIDSQGQVDGVHRFKYNGNLYSVARKDKLPGENVVREYNSNWYAIQL